MGTEIQSIQNLPSLKLTTNLSITRESDIDNDHRYTSLKDVILNSPTSSATNQDGYDFDCSNITIRNQLVKHAASAYLQSAMVLASQNQNYVMRFWEKLSDKATLSSCWRVYITNPIRACFQPIIQFFALTHGRDPRECPG
jgi:hypothetical protein